MSIGIIWNPVISMDDCLLYIKKEDVEAFKQMVIRACNTWPDAPPAIKDFHDRLIHGAPLQNYLENE